MQAMIHWDKAAPEEAFSEAQRRIVTAKATGEKKLELRDLKTLSVLPPEISRFSALRELVLCYLNVTNLSPLAGLTGLQRLTIVSVPVEDLAPLAGLAGLQVLNLSQLPASDVTPLAGLRSLKALSLQFGIRISELAPIADLQSLRYLSLESNRYVRDIIAVSKLTALTRLNLALTNVSDLSPLAGCACRSACSCPSSGGGGAGWSGFCGSKPARAANLPSRLLEQSGLSVETIGDAATPASIAGARDLLPSHNWPPRGVYQFRLSLLDATELSDAPPIGSPVRCCTELPR
jgi:Leucine-rich repeat (LRR) protein